MHKSTAKVIAGPLVFGGWKGELSIDGDVVRIEGADPDRSVVIDIREVKRDSFNSNNGLWVIRFKDGRRVRFQSAGAILSADRSAAGRTANDMITALLAQHNVRHFGV